VRCYYNDSDKVEENFGTCAVAKHHASSTRTMFSYLRKYLQYHLHFIITDSCLSICYRYISKKEKKEPVKHAKIFYVRANPGIASKSIWNNDSKKRFAHFCCWHMYSRTIFRINCFASRKTYIWNKMNCCLPAAEKSMCEPFHSRNLGFPVKKKKNFFDWDLLENMKGYLSCIPYSGPLWRRIPPSSKKRKF